MDSARFVLDCRLIRSDSVRRLKLSQLVSLVIMIERTQLSVLTLILVANVLLAASDSLLAAEMSQRAVLFERFCFDCHNAEESEAGIDLQTLDDADDFAGDFRVWQKVVAQLEVGTMPPEGANQPELTARRSLVTELRTGIRNAAQSHAGDPGPVVMRRLTSAEYAYSIRDVTGLDLDLAGGFASDAVGGAGFTNTGIAQFMQDSTLERYLEAARMISDRAVIGAGPLTFHQDPGQTGFELSAITRINDIYRSHGFRTAAGEGGEAFGLDKYPAAFYVAWLFRHRHSLGFASDSLGDLAKREGVSVRFAEHVSRVLTDISHPFPLSDVVDRWQRLAVPEQHNVALVKRVREECHTIVQHMLSWQDRFGENPDAKEEAPVLSDRSFDVSRTQDFIMNINWPKGTQTAHLVLSIESANKDGTPDAVVVWKNPELQFRIEDEVLKDPEPLKDFVSNGVSKRLAFGTHPRGEDVEVTDFVTVGTRPPAFEVPIIPGARSARLFVTAELDIQHGEDCIVRCTIAQLEETDQGKSVSGLLANPKNPSFEDWKAGVQHFARLMPQVSQREPAPSDRDPIPPPFDASYNNAERNYYHTHIKYHRDDDFLYSNMLDDTTRHELDVAWTDLFSSFEFYDLWLQFVARKYGIETGDRSIADVDDNWLETLPDDARRYINNLFADYFTGQLVYQTAQKRHVTDAIELAERAWRRPLRPSESDGLRGFYESLITSQGLSHRDAIRSVLTRIFVAPAFLYRVEPRSDARESESLTDWELASRLSYFLWSSPPDEELLRAAAAGELQLESELIRQAGRMLADPKARRFATEFFGQWFGFYHFDQYRGPDPKRFPEFTDSIRAAMYDEAIEFFSHIVRDDRPVNEILFADYTFLNDELAEFYGIPTRRVSLTAGEPSLASIRHSEPRRRNNAGHRGGLLRLGAVLTSTSAPLRTSPVKRGDWILRRVLGTPVPPPPADAGSIAADDVVSSGATIGERLAAHRRDAACNNCHSRIDPLGFALEHFDPLGRWRDKYRDGNSIEPDGTLRSGERIEGDAGLHRYLVSQQSRFHQTLCRKLLAYALGRQALVGDLPLLDEMAEDLAKGAGLSQLVRRIVVSRQFRERGRAMPNASASAAQR